MSRSRRRTHFAVPFVVVSACADAPPAHHPRHAHKACPTPAEVVPAPAPAPPRPPELVDELPPLEPRVSHPPHRTYRLAIRSMQRIPDGDGTRVRFALGDQRTTLEWEATIADASPDRDSACAIVAVGAYEVECRTALPPERVTGHTVSCTPPAALAAKLLEEDCRTGVAICNPPPPAQPAQPPQPPKKTVAVCPKPGEPPDPHGPTCNPPSPRWISARILKVDVQEDRVFAVVGNGSDDRVASRSKCRVPNEPTRTCTIVRVSERTTLVSIYATPEQVRDAPMVELETSPR